VKIGLSKRIWTRAHEEFMLVYYRLEKGPYQGPPKTLWAPTQAANLLSIEPWVATAAARHLLINDPKSFSVIGSVDKPFFVANALPRLWCRFKRVEIYLGGEDWLVRWCYDELKEIHKSTWD
jgi:hypothetical protein